MRIALFSGNYNFLQDGANRALNRLVGFLEDGGAQVRVYSPTTRTPAFAPTGTLVEVPSIPFPGRPEYRLALRFPKWLKHDIGAFRPDLVHLSAPDPLGYHALKFAKALGVPVVASLHTRFETYLDYYGLGWARSLGERYLQSFYGRCDYLLVPTAAIQNEFATWLGTERVRVWSRGVDRRTFAASRRNESWRRARGIGRDEIVVTFFGRLVLEKGTDVFVQAVRQLLARHPDIRALVIGDGPARRRMSEALPEAHFTGALSGDDLSEALASGDILINPSMTEAFGNVVLEAMSSGLVPVCADVASAQNLVRHGVTGLLCAPRDIAAYVAAVETLVDDHARLAIMKREAAEASKAFEWSGVLKQVVEVYEEAIAAKNVRDCRPPSPHAKRLAFVADQRS